LASLAVWMMMTGQPFPSRAEDILQPKYYNVNMVIQAVSTFFIFFAPVHFFAMICYRKPFKYLGFNSHFNLKQIFLIIGLLILTFPLSGALANLNNIIPIPHNWAVKFKAWEAAREAEEMALIQITSFSKYIISLFIIAFLPALFEETFFRAGMQNFLTRWFKGPWIAIIVTAIIFSLVHISYYGFLVRFALGVVLGLVFYYSGSVWLNILFHFLFNGVQVTILYIMTMKGTKDAKDIGENFPLWGGLIAFVALIYLFKIFKQTSLVEKEKYKEENIIEDDLAWTKNQS
jgi:membrane protease YdiL (CAAX protease family)